MASPPKTLRFRSNPFLTSNIVQGEDFLDREEELQKAQQFLQQKDRPFVFESECANQLYQLTHGHPFLVNA